MLKESLVKCSAKDNVGYTLSKFEQLETLKSKTRKRNVPYTNLHEVMGRWRGKLSTWRGAFFSSTPPPIESVTRLYGWHFEGDKTRSARPYILMLIRFLVSFCLHTFYLSTIRTPLDALCRRSLPASNKRCGRVFYRSMDKVFTFVFG